MAESSNLAARVRWGDGASKRMGVRPCFYGEWSVAWLGKRPKGVGCAEITEGFSEQFKGQVIRDHGRRRRHGRTADQWPKGRYHWTRCGRRRRLAAVQRVYRGMIKADRR